MEEGGGRRRSRRDRPTWVWVGRLECEIVGRGLDGKVGVREFGLCI